MPKPLRKPRMIRVEDDLWEQARQRAGERGESISDAVRNFLRRYVR